MAKEEGWKKVVQDSTTERRNNGRCPFIASAELVDLQSNSRLSARTMDLDRGGCYIDTINPLRVGTPVTLQLHKENRSFRTRAEVVYVQHGNGMGLAFANAEAEQSRILERWIAGLDATAAPNSSTADSVEPSEQQAVWHAKNHDETRGASPLTYLILMLVQKNILNETEGKALLKKIHLRSTEVLLPPAQGDTHDQDRTGAVTS